MNPPRPRDLALLLLSTDDQPPRNRARDQQPDVVGLAIRRRLLDRVAALDPEPNPESLAEALQRAIEEFGEPSGPIRGQAAAFLEEWRQTADAPGLWPYLLARAIESSETP